MSKTDGIDAASASAPAPTSRATSEARKAQPQQPRPQQHQQRQHPLPSSRRARLVVLAGPCGSGKTTVGIALSSLLGSSAPTLSVPFIDADNYHDAAAKKKMSSGTPLDDGDRAPWIARVASAARNAAVFSPSHVAVLACSSLKKKYRDALVAAVNCVDIIAEARGGGAREGGAGGSATPPPIVPAVDVDFVLLRARPSSLLARLEERRRRFLRSSDAAEEVAGHFLPPELLQSQLEIWEDSDDVVVVENDSSDDEDEKKSDGGDGGDGGEEAAPESATVAAIRTARRVLEAVGLDALAATKQKLGAAAAVYID